MANQPDFFDFAAEVGLTKHDEGRGILRRYGWGGMLRVMGDAVTIR